MATVMRVNIANAVATGLVSFGCGDCGTLISQVDGVWKCENDHLLDSDHVEAEIIV